MARKAAQATPNHLLRRARQEQGWTQKVVADRIGAPHDIMVTRWERGTVFPSAYYVERLCQLFGKHASELGLLQESSNQKAVERPHVNSTRFSSPEDLARPAGNTPTIQAVQQDSPTALISQLSLTGRDQEYHALVEAYHVVQRGQTRVVIIQGEAGIGKTRLAREFLSWVAEQGADVLLGRAFEAGGRLPYQALVDALRDHLEGENELSTSWLAELSRLFPELRDRYPDLSVPTADETSAHIRLFEAITRLMQVWAEHAPVVLFLDDLQWADAASLDLLQYALRRWTTSQTPLLLLASVRLEALHAAGSLLHWVTSLEHDLKVAHLQLDALTFDETQHLLRTLLTSGIDTLGPWLFHETQGQPLYLVETLKALLERGILTAHRRADGSWFLEGTAMTDGTRQLQDALPPGVREVIRTQLDHLTPAAFVLLVAGAVLGHRFTFEQVYQVAGLSENEGLPALEEVLAKRLLHEMQDEAAESFAGTVETYFFTHDKIRDVVGTEAGEARRRIFHQRALGILQTTSSPAAELAHHALAARLPVQAFTLSVTAGDEAMQLFAVRNALLHYKQAWQLVSGWQAAQNRLDNPTAEVVQHLFSQLGRAYEFLSDFAQAHATYQEMLLSARTTSLPAMECAALNRLATLSIQEFDLEQAMILLHQALQIAELHDDLPGQAETEWNLAELNRRIDLNAAIAHGKRALEFARQIQQPELIARCLNATAYSAKDAGHWEESTAYAQEALALYRHLGNRAMEGDCLTVLVDLWISNGQLSRASDAAQQAQKTALETENPWGQANVLYHLSLISLERGVYAEALALAQQCVSLALIHDLVTLKNLGLYMVGLVYRAMQAPDEARAAHLEVLAFFETTRNGPLQRLVAAELCADCALAGLWKEAISYARQALDPQEPNFALCGRLSRWYEIEALVRAGETEHAAENVRRFGESIGTSRRYRIPYLRALAILAEHRGEVGLATQHLQEAARLAEEIGLPGELWSIQAEVGELYLKQGETGQAADAFKTGAALMQKLANMVEDDAQRATFLGSPAVQRVLK